MRKALLAAVGAAALLVPTAASAQYYYGADPYRSWGPAYVAPAPMVESQVYMAPGTTYVTPGGTIVPGEAYDDQALYMNGQRYYRDCWWDWGRRRCDLKPWW